MDMPVLQRYGTERSCSTKQCLCYLNPVISGITCIYMIFVFYVFL